MNLTNQSLDPIRKTYANAKTWKFPARLEIIMIQKIIYLARLNLSTSVQESSGQDPSVQCGVHI